MKKSTELFDRRLIGVWKSDRKKTFECYKPHPSLSKDQVRKLRLLFGKMEVQWRRKTVRTSFNGITSTEKYEVVSQDATSVVVKTRDLIFGGERLCQIHFNGSHYFLVAGGSMLEWFKKVK